MQEHLYIRLASGNVKRNARTYVPYTLTCILMTAMFYIIHSLSVNDGLLEMYGGAAMLSILDIGTKVTAIFSVIFLLYTNSFLIKNRKKEFGIFNILGMEKRHIAMVILMETLFIAAVSLLAGFAFGIILDKAMFLLLTKFIGGEITLGFHISMSSLIKTAILFAAVHLFTYLNALRQVQLARPIELLKGSNTGEREPKAKWLMAILGIACLAGGYYISLTTKDLMAALGMFFIAVLLVIAGTYLLFTAGSIVLLKLLRKNKSYYYKPRHFMSVSGMIYRMKQNAVGLANICILSTCVLVMISTTSSFMLGMDGILKTRYPEAFRVEIVTQSVGLERSKEEVAVICERIAQESQSLQPENSYAYSRLDLLVPEEEITSGWLGTGDFGIVSVMTQEDYNSLYGDTVSLAEDEILVCGWEGTLPDTELTLFGSSYHVQGAREAFPDKNVVNLMEYLYIVVRDADVMQHLYEAQNPEHTLPISFYTGFDTDASKEEQLAVYDRLYEEFFDDSELYVRGREAAKGSFLSLYGGLFFLGIYLGTLFMVATILMIYYKQISEGYDDKERFAIMQKVGMSLAEIKRTIHSQIMIVFFLPLVMAGIHVAFAFPIIKQIMYQSMGMRNIPLYIGCIVGCFLVFTVCYGIIYTLTARTYYKIVAAKRQ